MYKCRSNFWWNACQSNCTELGQVVIFVWIVPSPLLHLFYSFQQKKFRKSLFPHNHYLMLTEILCRSPAGCHYFENIWPDLNVQQRIPCYILNIWPDLMYGIEYLVAFWTYDLTPMYGTEYLVTCWTYVTEHLQYKRCSRHYRNTVKFKYFYYQSGSSLETPTLGNTLFLLA